jgi:pimeloyl-ACP methyl ester carboxylesterase
MRAAQAKPAKKIGSGRQKRPSPAHGPHGTQRNDGLHSLHHAHAGPGMSPKFSAHWPQMPHGAAILQGLRRTCLQRTLAVLLAVLLQACAGMQPTVRPLRQVAHPAPCAEATAAPRPLVVLMPGRAMALSELSEQGLVAGIRRRGFDVDLLTVDAHIGYYQERTVFEALRDDVVAPARARGVREVWLAGISLGGYGALLYDARHPGEIAGVVAIAPYLGLDAIVDEVAAAGMLHAWRPPVLEGFTPATSPADTDRHLWRWLQSQTGAVPEAGERRMPIFLGFGDRDRYARAQRLAAAALPADRTVVRPGDHDWPAWREAWDALLDRVPWTRRPACVNAG